MPKPITAEMLHAMSLDQRKNLHRNALSLDTPAAHEILEMLSQDDLMGKPKVAAKPASARKKTVAAAPELGSRRLGLVLYQSRRVPAGEISLQAHGGSRLEFTPAGVTARPAEAGDGAARRSQDEALARGLADGPHGDTAGPLHRPMCDASAGLVGGRRGCAKAGDEDCSSCDEEVFYVRSPFRIEIRGKHSL